MEASLSGLVNLYGDDAVERLTTALTRSAELEAVIGKGPMPRGQVVAKLWEYIKANGLQDPLQKRMINCDPSLRLVFGKDKVSMFEMASLISKHVKAIP